MEAREGCVGEGGARRNWRSGLGGGTLRTGAFGALEGKLEKEARRHTHFRRMGARFSADVCFRLTAHLHHLQHHQIRPTLNPQAVPLPLSSMTQGKNLPILLETLTSKRKDEIQQERLRFAGLQDFLAVTHILST